MKKTTLALALAGLTGFGGHVQANEWTFLTGTKQGYTAEPTISLMLGRMSPGDDFRSSAIAGVELSLNCPLLQPPTNRIRQQVSLTWYDKGRNEITSLEINPHYVVEVAPGLELGAGPGLGLVMVDTATGDGNVLGVQFGASAHYHGNSPLFIGAEARYQLTTESRFGGGQKTDVNNFRFGIKVGYSF